MMRVTNSMIVKRSKTNINTNRAKVDYTNNQMSSQKKITKPSDNPIIAIRSLRLRSTLSTITQYYENNIPDTNSWMKATETALVNMKDILKDAYEKVVYGSTDSLNSENRKTIYKDLQSLQDQIYCEGNSDYAGRTIFTGYKTNQMLTFTDPAEANDAHYDITENFTYKDIEQKKYYVNSFDAAEDMKNADPKLFKEETLNRVRLAYDGVTKDGTSLSISYKDGNSTVNTVISQSNQTIGLQGCTFQIGNSNQGTPPTATPVIKATAPYGYVIIPAEQTLTAGTTTPYTFALYKQEDVEYTTTPGTPTPIPGASFETISVSAVDEPTAAPPFKFPFSIGTPAQNISYRVTDTASLKKDDYKLEPDEIVFNSETGELLLGDDVAKAFDQNRVSFNFSYSKTGFDTGELRPEHYFNCSKYVEDRKNPIEYKNYDEAGNWNTQAIYYNIAGGQQMQINTEAKDVFNADIRRDMDDLLEIVDRAIKAQDTVDAIEKELETCEDKDKERLNKWLDSAKTQRDYANQNMHDSYSAYITKFQNYRDTVNLTITDIGGRGERVTLTENRMSIQQSTFKELKSSNEDMDLSDLVINYSAATVAYQAALQASAKIGKMTLLDYI